MVEKTVRIKNRVGLHARPAARFAELAQKFNSEISIVKSGKKVNGKSILDILGLGIGKGSTIRIVAEGDDEEPAIEQLIELINSFEENE